MSCVLGGVTLPKQVFWPDESAGIGPSVASRRTRGGALHQWFRPRMKGRPITLEINHPWCWLEESTRQALMVLAGSTGQVHLLSLDGDEYQVTFRDPPFEFVPLAYTKVSGGDRLSSVLWTGKIFLTEV